MMLIPFVLFWVLLFLGRRELGLKWILILIGLWVGAVIGACWAAVAYGEPRTSGYIFGGIEALVDIGLLIYIFGGDIPLFWYKSR